MTAPAPMTPPPGSVDQTIFHDDPDRPGNCFAAAVATAVGRPLSEVPHFIEWGQFLHDGRRKCTDYRSDPDADRQVWWGMFLGFCAGLGVWPVTIDSLDDAEPDEIVFVSGPSPRGVSHQVLYRGGQLWHDPHPSRAGILYIHPDDDLFVLRPAGEHDHDPTTAGEAAS